MSELFGNDDIDQLTFFPMHEGKTMLADVYQFLEHKGPEGASSQELIHITHRFSAPIHTLRRKYQIEIVTEKLGHKKFRYYLKSLMRKAT